MRRSARVAALTCAALAAGLLPAAGVADAAQPTRAAHADGRLFTSPDTALGEGWKSSSDVAVTGTGDTAGFHVLRADESSSFAYKQVADLRESALGDIGPWTGYVCTTGSGRYAAAVYAPSMITNKPAMMAKDAFAAVVDLATGKVTKPVTGVELAYYSPGCGATDTVTFTRSGVGDDGHGDTTVYDVAAATGKVVRTSIVHGQFTNPLPTANGDDLGVLGGKLVKVSAGGRTTALTPLKGRLFGLAPSQDGAVDLATVQGGKDTVTRWDGKLLTPLGTAPLGSLALFTQAHGDLVTGAVQGIDTAKAPGLAKTATPVAPVAASRAGHLLITSVASEQLKGLTSKIGELTDDEGAGDIHLSALAAASGTTASTNLVTADVAGSTADDVEPMDGDGNLEKDVLGGGGVSLDDSSAESHYSSCLVKRNDVNAQALQPSANMVEWAADQAVHGDLNVSRPANYLATGEGAYTPQGMFPLQPLTGGGTVPANVLLGVMAQESNFKQASWHAVPGDGGNPTLGDYYGNGDSIHYYPNYGASDCGYGISQVTTGMSEIKGDPYTPDKAYAIATDYAANIAAGLRILSQTWNQLKGLGMNVNNGSASHIENWYMALWGYNSGVYTDSSQNNGHIGLGWFNNPANPHYKADRQPFLRGSYDDASHPADWPYQEKIMGWVETPQLTYNGKPSYGTPVFPISPAPSYQLNLDTNYSAYCNSSNACTPNQTPDACPSEDESCWWHSSVSWFDDTDLTASTEALSYSLGSGEPALERQYPQGSCNSAPGTLSTILIDDLPNPDENIFGCKESAQPQGKFNLRLGDNFTHDRGDGTWRATEDIAPIDLHQIGGGYDGHFWFTHAYSSSDTNYLWHKVTAMWTPDPGYLPASDQAGDRYDVYVHLPDHGANAVVKYTLEQGNNTQGATSHTCNLNQATKGGGKDTWVELGTASLWKGATLTADNTSWSYDSTTDGTKDAAYDAVAFAPAYSASTTGICWGY